MNDKLIGPASRRGGVIAFAVVALILLAGSRFIAGAIIDYEWWKEIRQVDTWWSLLLYSTVPVAIAVILLYFVFLSAFLVGIRQTRELFRDSAGSGWLKKIGIAGLAVLAFLVADAMVDNWTVVRYFGGQRLSVAAGEYHDPIFNQPLHFYFFELPFLNLLLGVLLAASICALIIFWLASHADRFSGRFSGTLAFDFEPASLSRAFESAFFRTAAAILLLGIAGKLYLARYGLLLEDHGTYLVGVDWVADHVVLPLQWLLIFGCVLAAGLIAIRKPQWALALLLLLPIRWLLPPLISGLYVRPNELALEKPYIAHHIQATRSAYGLETRVTEKSFDTTAEVSIDQSKDKALLDNVRLWDWKAFHDTISQIQPLRPYIYRDTDIDRYTIDGQMRQVLVSPRELEVDQIGEASSRWINPHLIYTHGYGVVMAEANRIASDGLPYLLIKDAPPVLTTKSLQLNQPEIYYSEEAHEPVFVDTAQSEFNYPAGSQTVQTKYSGQGGIPIGTALMRLVAALHYGDANILLTEYLTGKSRMMIHRGIQDRLNTIAPFLTWDSDPYIVVTASGRLVWIADGYMSSASHPYSRQVSLRGEIDAVNYMRNSVKATIDAYTGETTLYIFDDNDVLIRAYSKLLPGLFKASSEMPADLRAHVRYPETLFQVQAQIYRTFHMRAPEDFYNRADAWDLAKTANSANNGAEYVSPSYVVAALPGSSTPEFMLITTFTPSNKDNLIGVMYARCDGEHLGELLFAQLAKQSIIFGPMQIDARVNQDQVISKDLTLWDQRGSAVLRPQTLVLPIGNSFLYVAPIYIRSSQASMPQLKKVALAMGNKLAYADTYEQALAQLIGDVGGHPSDESTPSNVATQTSLAPAIQGATETIKQIRNRLDRYRELSSQGKWAEAGKELDEIQRLVR